jgi:hypothetical protein
MMSQPKRVGKGEVCVSTHIEKREATTSYMNLSGGLLVDVFSSPTFFLSLLSLSSWLMGDFITSEGWQVYLSINLSLLFIDDTDIDLSIDRWIRGIGKSTVDMFDCCHCHYIV